MESEHEGFKFLGRLLDDWHSGSNRFDRDGEVLLLAVKLDDVVGVGGLNIDPYADDAQVARIRHVYIGREHRRCEIGRRIVAELIEYARQQFREVRLRTDTVSGDLFYRALGFEKFTATPAATHFMPV